MPTLMTADPDTAQAALEPLARNRDFKVVLVGQGVSSFGDAVTNTALPLLVLALTGSGFAMGSWGRSRRSRTSWSGFRPERTPIAGTAAG